MTRREFDPEDADGHGETSRYTAHLDRGWSLLDRGDLQHARNSAHQARRLRPDVPDAAMLMAAISLAEGDADSSLEWYERAIEADAEYVDAQLAAAQLLLYDLDEPQRALARAEQARELDEATTADRLELGLIEIEAMISLDDLAGARARLESLAEIEQLAALFDPDRKREELDGLLAGLLGEGESLDDDDSDLIMGRVIGAAIRVARAHLDLGEPGRSLPWLQGLLQRFGDDAEIWYLYNEAAYLAGDGFRAAHAALQVLQRDARAPVPEWAPEPASLHRKVVDLLLGCADPQLRALAREPGFVVVVNEAPPFELVLEGVDPRVRGLALATRAGQDADSPPVLTALALYRRNLLRLVNDVAGLERELAFAVFDELAVFFGFDDVRRDALGLPPAELAGTTWPGPDPRRGQTGAAPAEPAPADIADIAATATATATESGDASTRKKSSKRGGKRKKTSDAGKTTSDAGKTTSNAGKKTSKKTSKKKPRAAKPADDE